MRECIRVLLNRRFLILFAGLFLLNIILYVQEQQGSGGYSFQEAQQFRESVYAEYENTPLAETVTELTSRREDTGMLSRLYQAYTSQSELAWEDLKAFYQELYSDRYTKVMEELEAGHLDVNLDDLRMQTSVFSELAESARLAYEYPESLP